MGFAVSFTGPHRSGKSTLAAAFAPVAGLAYRPFPTAQIVERAGLALNRVETLAQRINFQEAILMGAIKFFRASGDFVTDRSPLDLAAYMLADVRNEPISESDDLRIQAFVRACVNLANETISQGFVLQPVLPYVAEPGKPHANRSYQLHHLHTLWGLAQGENVSAKFVMVAADVVSVEDRVSSCISECARSVAAFAKSARKYYAA